jgi:hypothetical protein
VIFKIGDAVENIPATVDGIVYRVEGDKVRFCDERTRYLMDAAGLRHRYEPFSWDEKRRIMETFPHLFPRRSQRRR